MTPLRYPAALIAAATLCVAGCDNSAEHAKQAAQEPPSAQPAPPAAVAPTPTPAPAPAVPSQPTAMAKPPGADPAKLAEHAKALAELGYKDEAAKLYGHACDWGYAPACTQLKAPSPSLARENAVPDKPAPSKPAAVVAQAPAAKPVASPAAPPAPTTAPVPAAIVPQPAAPVPAAAPAPAAPPAASPPPVVVAVAKPAPAAEKPAVGVDAHKLSQQAHGLEEIGYLRVALKLYKDACLAGDGQACKRLGEIYIKGSNGVERDYAESIRWYDRARQLGVAVPTLEKRAVYR